MATWLEAHAEILEGFTLNLGVKAQSYEPQYGTSYDPESGVVARFAANEAAFKSLDRFRRTLAFVGGWDRWCLELLFDRRLALGASNGLLTAAITGSETGNLVALAPLTSRAQRLVTRERGADVDVPHHEVLRILEDHAGKGATSMLAEVKAQALELRQNAVAAYQEVMTARRGEERRAREDRFSDLLARRAS